MERRENWILRDVIVFNGTEIRKKYQSSFMFFCLFVLFFMVRMDVLQGLMQGIIIPGASPSLILASFLQGWLNGSCLMLERGLLGFIRIFIRSAE